MGLVILSYDYHASPMYSRKARSLSKDGLDDVRISFQSAFQRWKKVTLDDRIIFTEEVNLHMTKHLESSAHLSPLK